MAMAILTMDLIINDSDKRDEIVALMAAVNKMMPSADGIIIHDWYANLWEPNRIRLYIESESREKVIAFEGNPPPEFVKANQKLFAYQQSGALTMQFEGLRRFEVGPELTSSKLTGEQTMAMVIISGEMIINDPDKRDEIVALLAEINQIDALADGMIFCDWYANLWEPNRLRHYIEMESREKVLAFEENPPPGWVDATKKLKAYEQSGATTTKWEAVRHFELGPELPPFAVHPE